VTCSIYGFDYSVRTWADVAALATILGAATIFVALLQLHHQSRLARSTFENLFVQQYQQLIQALPAGVLLGLDLTPAQVVMGRWACGGEWVDRGSPGHSRQLAGPCGTRSRSPPDRPSSTSIFRPSDRPTRTSRDSTRPGPTSSSTKTLSPSKRSADSSTDIT
jgi:hypothetical protein